MSPKRTLICASTAQSPNAITAWATEKEIPMYIDPFVAGVIATILVELALLLIVGAKSNKK